MAFQTKSMLLAKTCLTIPSQQDSNGNLESVVKFTMIKLALGTASALTVISLCPGSAQAYVATVNGVQCDVTTYTGAYVSNISKFALPLAPEVVPCGRGTSSLPHRSLDIAWGDIDAF